MINSKFATAMKRALNEAMNSDSEPGEEGEPGEKPFGISDDGWDKEDLEELVELLDNTERLSYEIKNARRGAYALDDGTMPALIEKLTELGEGFSRLANTYTEAIEK